MSAGRPHIPDIYTSSLVWNDLTMALSEQQKHLYLRLGGILKFMGESNCANSAKTRQDFRPKFTTHFRMSPGHCRTISPYTLSISLKWNTHCIP